MSTLERDAGSGTPSPVGEAPAVAIGDRALGDRALRRLAGLLAGVAVLEAVAIIALGARGDPRFPMGFDLVTIGFLGTIVSFAVVGAVIILRRPRTRVAWVMIGIGISIGTGVLLGAYGALFVTPSGENLGPFALEILILSSILFVPALGFGTTMLMLLYPTDSLLGPRWRTVALLSLAGSLAWNLGVLLRPGPIDHQVLDNVPNPLGAPAELAPALEALTGIGNLFAILAIALAAGSLLLRYRRGDSVVRAQIRWFALIAAVLVVSLALTAVLGPDGELFFEVGVTALACLPIAIGVAITRYRLYDIDLIINRTLVYGSLTAILAGVFTAGVGLGQRLFVTFTGASSDAAIVLATLVIATLYAPLRKRLEAVIDKRFKYETRRFGSYGDKVKTVLAVIDPVRASESLAREAVSELGAMGAAVIGPSGTVLATAGTWPVPGDVPPTRITIADEGPIRAILVGAARGGRAHAPDDLAALEDVGRLAASAALLQQSPGPSRRRPGGG